MHGYKEVYVCCVCLVKDLEMMVLLELIRVVKDVLFYGNFSIIGKWWWE